MPFSVCAAFTLNTNAQIMEINIYLYRFESQMRCCWPVSRTLPWGALIVMKPKCLPKCVRSPALFLFTACSHRADATFSL